MPALSEIRSLTSPPESGAQAVRRDWALDERFRADVPRAARGLVRRAMTWSMNALERLPMPSLVAASGAYEIYTNTSAGPCASGGYASPHNCSPGCGPSTVCGGRSGGPCCSGGWHRRDGSTYSGYQLRPNQCWAGYYDGWLWRCSSTVRYRCHDGWTYSGGRKWKTICRANV